MAINTMTMVVPVDSAHRLDEGRLLSYLQTHVKGFLPPPASLKISQVKVLNLKHLCFAIHKDLLSSLYSFTKLCHILSIHQLSRPLFNEMT